MVHFNSPWTDLEAAAAAKPQKKFQEKRSRGMSTLNTNLTRHGQRIRVYNTYSLCCKHLSWSGDLFSIFWGDIILLFFFFLQVVTACSFCTWHSTIFHHMQITIFRYILSLCIVNWLWEHSCRRGC